MARVFRKPGSATWWLDYADASGRRHRVRTTTTSKRAATELLAEVTTDVRRLSLGLDTRPTSQMGTLGDAWLRWLKDWCPEASRAREVRRYNANVRGGWLAAARLVDVDGAKLDRWFGQCLKRGQAPSTVNGHRRIIRNIYNNLLRRRLYRGLNPVAETKPLEETEYPYQLLTELELKRLLPHLPDNWRDLIHLAFVSGLRRGELYALRKDRAVVDFERGILTPRASNTRGMVKGKRVRSIPLTPDAAELLKRAWDKTAAGELLFPGPDGKMRSEHLRPAEVLRSAMGRAGLVEGWLHRCRWGCKVEQRHDDEQQRKCPRCKRVLWPVPVVRRVRFHDLRHSIANHLIDRGVPLGDVQLYLRHSTLAITEKTYRHRTVEALRQAVTHAGPEQLERQLQLMAQGQPSAVAQVLREASSKLALVRHQGAPMGRSSSGAVD